MAKFLGIDLGTSGVKAALFDETGAPIASASVDYPLSRPRDGWAEQDPDVWWASTVEAVRRVAAGGDKIESVGLSGQMHGLVMLDGDGKVIRPAILWCDGRTGPQCAELTRRLGRERLIELSGNPALAGFTAGKILWIAEHEPESMARCRAILLPKDYIRFMLTGELATDAGDASGTNLLDIRTRRWSAELTEAAGVDPSLLPPVLESCEIAGRVTRAAAEATGLREGTPVAAGSGDNACAAAGTGVVREGSAFTTLGTSGVVYAHTDAPRIDPSGRVHTFCSAVPGGWALMSCTLAAGASLKWFRANLCGEDYAAAKAAGKNVYALLDAKAAEVAPGAGGLIFLPYVSGERSPVLDERCRGVFFGLSAVHTKYDMLRALMEGVAFSQRQCLDILRSLGARADDMLACGGGASGLWRQMLADNYKVPVRGTLGESGAALGAALTGAVAAGIFPDLPTACDRCVTRGEATMPDPAAAEAYDKIFPIYGSLYPALKGAFAALADYREAL